MTDPRAEHARRGRLHILTAFATALADPVRLVQLLADAPDDAEAARRLREAFDLDEEQAVAVLDLQLRRVTAGRRAELARETARAGQAWGPPLTATLHFDGPGRAVLAIDGAEHAFSVQGSRLLLDQVWQHLRDRVAVPRLRPVVVDVVAGPPGAPARVTVFPDGSTEFGYEGD